MLALLAERPMHGYEMISELAARTGGSWRPSPGSVYPSLQALEEEGLITATADGGRRAFTLTPTGRELITGLGEPWAEFASPPPSDGSPLRASVEQLVGAVEQVLLTGTAEQKARVARTLDGTRRSIYAILAEDGGPPPTGN